MTSNVLFGATLFFYFLATAHYVLFLINQKESIGKVAQITTIIAFAVHTLYLIYQMVYLERIPITNLRESLGFFAWAIIANYIFLEYKVKTRVMGAFIIPLAFIALAVSLTFQVTITPLPEYFSSAWLGVHTTLAFLADAAFAIGFGVGIMYLIQDRQLKSRHIGPLYRRLPNIGLLDELSYKAIALGFPLLTLGMMTGMIWASTALHHFWSWEPKEVWSLITWIIYASYLHMRLVAGWRGRKSAYMSVVGFLLVLFTFLGVNLLMPGYHAFK